MATAGNSLTLGLLPEHKINRRAMATSYGAVILLVLILINIGLLFPQRIKLAQYHISSWIPVDLKPPKPEAPHKQMVQRKLPPPPPVFAAKLTVPREMHTPRSQPQPEMAAPKIDMSPKFAPAVFKTSGARPELVVHTGEFGSSATVTVSAPVQKVQTGGFGDPNGIAGQGKPNAKLGMANTGSFDLPSGPGKGNGTGGAKGIAGNIASAGFGSGIASPGQGDGRKPGRGEIQTAGFATQQAAPATKAERQLETGPATTPVQISFKPNPVYTDEARQLRLEGEVLLEVMFGANGQLHVNRVVRGLGHGLDDAAVAAAGKMRFKPAQREGQAVDSTAVVHVVFQLAY